MPVRLLGRLVVVLLLDAVALLGLAWILPGFTLDDPWPALVLAAVLGVANAVVWPFLLRFALPFTVLTLGLGALVLNARAAAGRGGRCSTTSTSTGCSRRVGRGARR